ncbi:MAG TPA: DUF4837 family protein [Prolixibacteraceae bacterium]|nr:DUF4837 family protein [Prolixibacteraceae bacterium]
MKRITNHLTTLILLSLVIFSCDNPGAKMETITGKSGEVIVVIGKEVWNGPEGSEIRQILAQTQSSLPQEEPIFNLINVPPEAFIKLFKTSRNILTVKISSTYTEPKIEFTNDTWAYPQAVVNIQASSPENFEELIQANSDKIIAYFLKAEKDRLKDTYKASYEKGVYNTLLDEFHIQLYVPTGFKIVKKDSNFVWIRYDTPLITQNILVYTYPYDSDSTFTQKYQLIKRNIITKDNVSGPQPGSYMTTEMELPQDFNILTLNGNYASEMRGLWRVENDFMGGPFISLSVLDASRRRIVTVEGNVFAPKNNKRNYLRQVEAMVYSLEFPSQKVNDKITKQLEVGN